MQRSVCCNVCDEWTHTKCTRLSNEEFDVHSSTEKPFYCVKCLYEKNDPNTLNSVLSNSSCNMLSSLPVNPRCSSDAVPSSFWLSDVYESANRYFDIDEFNILQSGTENNEVTIIHVNAVSIFLFLKLD